MEAGLTELEISSEGFANRPEPLSAVVKLVGGKVVTVESILELRISMSSFLQAESSCS